MSAPLDYFFNSAFSVPLSPVVFVVLMLVLAAVSVLAFLVVRLHGRIRDLMYPVYDEVVKKAEKDADRILLEARELARTLRSRAELDAARALEEKKKEGDALHTAFVKEFTQLAEEEKALLEKEIQTIKKLSAEATAGLQKETTQAEAALKEETETLRHFMSDQRSKLESALVTLAEKTEQERTALREQHTQQLTAALQKEINEARAAVGAYRVERMKLVDQEILTLVEEVVHVALNKSLSLKEHADFIEQALVQAKKEGIFASVNK